MVVCKYFLRGDCRFGDRCRFEHPRNRVGGSTGYNQYNSPLRQYPSDDYNSYGPNNQQQQVKSGGYGGFNQNQNRGGGNSKVQFSDSFGLSNRFGVLSDSYQDGNTGRAASSGGGPTGSSDPSSEEIIESIKRDVEEWEASKMWPFSSYRATKAQADIPEFEDLSPEEMRFTSYTLEKEKKFEQYVSAVTAASNAMQSRRDLLKAPSPELRNTLVEIYRGQHRKSSFLNSSIFGSREPTVLEYFNQSLANISQPSATSSFTSSSSSSFGHGGSSFGNQSSSTPSTTQLGSESSAPAPGFFSSGSTTPSTGPIQGGPPPGLFGKPQNTSSGLFGKPQDSNQGLFGKSQGPNPGVFGKSQDSNQGLFGSSQDSNKGLFGKSQDSNQGLFGKPQDSNQGLFGKPQDSNQGLFGKPQDSNQVSTQGLFGKAPTGLFGKGSPSSGLFGKPASSGFNNSQVSSKLYTPMSELTEEEKAQFEAESFTLGKIPTRPPPVELVNRAG